MKKLTAEFKKDPASAVSGLYLGLLFLLHPLVLRDGFFNVVETKALFYTGLTALYLAAMLWLLRPGRLSLREGRDRGTLWGLLFCLLGILASLLGGYPAQALLGRDNRYQGILTLLLYGGMLFSLSRCRRPGPLPLWGLLGGFAATALLGVLNYLGADPLGTMTHLRDFDRGRYLAGLGNVNFYGAYFTLTLPAVLLLAVSAEKRWQRLSLGLLSLAGLWGALCARCESTLLGLGAALLCLPFLLRERPEARRRALWLWPGLGLGMLGFSFLCAAAGAEGLSALTRFLLRPAVLLLWAAAGMGWYWLSRRHLRLCGRLLAGLLAAGALGLLLVNLLPVPLPGALENILIFDGDWGTDRGKIWGHCLALFRELPLPQKLLGGGSGCLARWDLEHRIFADAVLDTAHNEYLHYLLTGGILGLGAYLGFLAAAVRQGLRSRRLFSLALLAGVIAYGVQAAVNIAQPATTPLFFAAAAMLLGDGDT